jgi:hypothetical protein
MAILMLHASHMLHSMRNVRIMSDTTLLVHNVLQCLIQMAATLNSIGFEGLHIVYDSE